MNWLQIILAFSHHFKSLFHIYCWYLLYCACSQEDLEALEGSPALAAVCPVNNNHPSKKNKSTPQSTMNSLVSTKRPLPNKSEKLSEEKLWRNTLIKEATPINSKKSPTPIKLSPIPKRDNCMMNTVRKVFRTVVHLEVVEWETSLAAFSVEEAKEIPDPERPNLSLLKFKSHSMMCTLALWKMSTFKGTETVRNAMEKVVKMYKNVQNAKAREWFKSWCS